MADVKISQLTEVTANTGTDLLECVQSGASRRTTVQKLLDWIKAQATTWTGKQTFQGYTVLGESSPAVKLKKIAGTTDSAEGGSVVIAHGLGAKIVAVSVSVQDAGGIRVAPNFLELPGRQFDFLFDGTNVAVYNHPTNSENILSRPITILVTYEE